MIGTHQEQNLLGLVERRHWRSLGWNEELTDQDNEQRWHLCVVDRQMIGFFGENFLIFEELALEIDVSKDSRGTLDVFTIRMMLVQAILEPGKGNAILDNEPKTWGVFLEVFQWHGLDRLRVEGNEFKQTHHLTNIIL